MSRERLLFLFSFSDVSLLSYVDIKSNEAFSLCPFCLLKPIEKNCVVKAYGWLETDTTITWKVRISLTACKEVVLPKPRLHDINKVKKGYNICQCINDEYKMVSFVPACVYISKHSVVNLKILAARVCMIEDTLVATKCT